MADPLAATVEPPVKRPLLGPNPLIPMLGGLLAYIGEMTLLLGEAARRLFRQGVNRRDLIEQCAAIGANSVPIAMLTSLSSGAVIALYFAPFLKQYGVESFVGGVVGLAVSRELTPVLTGVVTAARAGSAIAAELGTMKVTEQIDALRALAVSPVQYLVVPRLLAALIMVPLVCALSDAVGILGGYVVSVYLEHVPAASFPQAILQALEPADFLKGIFKTFIFGGLVALVGCHQGLRTEGGATEVGRATTNAVVLSIVLIYVTNFFLAYFLFQRTVSL